MTLIDEPRSNWWAMEKSHGEKSQHTMTRQQTTYLWHIYVLVKVLVKKIRKGRVTNDITNVTLQMWHYKWRKALDHQNDQMATLRKVTTKICFNSKRSLEVFFKGHGGHLQFTWQREYSIVVRWGQDGHTGRNAVQQKWSIWHAWFS